MGRGTIALAAAAVTLLLPGCGGSDDPGVTTSTISKETFVRKVDAICEESNERVQARFSAYLKGKENLRKAIKHPSKADYEVLIVKTLVPSIEREIREIRALGAPSGDEDRVGEMLTALEEGTEVAEDDPAAVTASSDAIFGIFSRLAGEYGLEACGSR